MRTAEGSFAAAARAAEEKQRATVKAKALKASWERSTPLVTRDQAAHALATIRGETQPIAIATSQKRGWLDEIVAAVHVPAAPGGAIAKYAGALERAK